MNSKQLRQKFLDFMASKGHAILPSASLVPKEDPTVLFINSGMQPLVPYLMGQPHPAGNRLADSQKCLRTGDIEEVGDNRHLSFFEMLGNWSLGDYFKRESLEAGFEFLTSKEWLGLDPNRLFVTVYKGFGDVGPDEEAIQIWSELFNRVGVEPEVGIEYDFKNTTNPENGKFIYRITKKSGKDNWWGLPYRGPCGPCSEIYYLLNHHELDFYSKFYSMEITEVEDFIENQIVEIWNHVFMAYEGEWGENNEPKNLVPLEKKNIDTGTGFERILAVLQGVDTVQKTDTLKPISDVATKWSATKS
jgi:alanyl-tRNA synthetase